MNSVVMYIFVNSDLGMKKGKVASQVGHCVQQIVENVYQSNVPSIVKTNYKLWNKDLNAKIILKASQNDLDQLKNHEYAITVYDTGRTQIPENSLTVVGFYPLPKKETDCITKQFKLL